MKRCLSLVIVLCIVFISCAPTIPVAEFKDSNQYFIDKTAQKLKIRSLLDRTTTKGSKISVVSMEIPQTLDAPIISTIEDQIISQAVVNGNVVYERDPDLLKYLIEEKSNSNYSIASQSQLQKYIEPDTVFVRLFETQLEPADYILAYRILECGLMYRKGSSQKYKKREGLVRLHVRLINTESGRILLAGNLTAQHEDEVRSVLVRKLKDFHYEYFSHELPVQKNKKYIIF